MFPKLNLLQLAAMLFLAVTASAHAETHEVKMLNADPDDPSRGNVFSPEVLRIEPGDRVRFEALDKGHNSASKRGMLPEGAEPWNGAMDQEIEVAFTVEGTYGYICLPHYQMGMVGLILVGNHRGNLETARTTRQRGAAAKAFKALLEKVDALTQ